MMPFTVFTSAHKQQMLKWLEGLRSSGVASPVKKLPSLLAIDVQPDGVVSVIKQDGSAAPDARVDPGGALFGPLSSALARCADVWVSVDGSSGAVLSWHEGADHDGSGNMSGT